MRNTFNFDGVQSSDYGVYISGKGTFDAPERDFEAVEVPGRNGILTLDNGRFQLQRHKYPAFVVPPFRDNVRGLRNALMSKRGAHRLTDTYNPDEYYQAFYERGLEVDPEKNLTVGAMDIVFTRDPRRFLLTGDTPVELGEWGETTIATCDVVTIDNDGTHGVKNLSVAIEPIQAGSGDPSPTNVRAISGTDAVNVYRCGKNIIDMTFGNSVPSISTGQMVAANGWSCPYVPIDNAKDYTFTFTGTAGRYIFFYDSNLSYLGYVTPSNGYHLSQYANYAQAKYIKARSDAGSGQPPQFQIEEGDTATEYEPYVGQTYTAALGRTVYGGTLDVVSGTLTVDRVAVDMGLLTWYRSTSYSNPIFYATITGKASDYRRAACSMFRNIGSASIIAAQGFANNSNDGDFASSNGNAQIFVRCDSKTDAASFKTYVNGQTLVYPLATPETYNLTPTQVELLLGENHLWSDTGAVSVEYGTNPNMVVNPTLFASRPVIRVYGHGTLTVGDVTVTVAQNPYEYIDIDSEMMDCYHGDDNANSYVGFSDGEFPELPAGATTLSYSGSITKVIVTPHWWRL